MDITHLLPTELFLMILDIINGNPINIVLISHTNKKLHEIVSTYGKNKSIIKLDCKYAVTISFR